MFYIDNRLSEGLAAIWACKGGEEKTEVIHAGVNWTLRLPAEGDVSLYRVVDGDLKCILRYALGPERRVILTTLTDSVLPVMQAVQERDDRKKKEE